MSVCNLGHEIVTYKILGQLSYTLKRAYNVLLLFLLCIAITYVIVEVQTSSQNVRIWSGEISFAANEIQSRNKFWTTNYKDFLNSFSLFLIVYVYIKCNVFFIKPERRGGVREMMVWDFGSIFPKTLIIFKK